MTIRVAGIAGSLRAGSLNKGLLRAAVESAPAAMEIASLTRSVSRRCRVRTEMKLLGAKLRGIFAKFSEALPPSLPTPPKQSLRLRRPGAKATEGAHLAFIHGFTPVDFCEGGQIYGDLPAGAGTAQ